MAHKVLVVILYIFFMISEHEILQKSVVIRVSAAVQYVWEKNMFKDKHLKRVCVFSSCCVEWFSPDADETAWQGHHLWPNTHTLTHT